MQLSDPNWPFGQYNDCILMLKEQLWVLWRTSVQVGVSIYNSGLLGLHDLEASKYWIYIKIDTKWSQNWRKIINFSYSCLCGLQIDHDYLCQPFSVFQEFFILFKEKHQVLVMFDTNFTEIQLNLSEIHRLSRRIWFCKMPKVWRKLRKIRLKLY